MLNDRQAKMIARRFRLGLDGFKGGLGAETYIAITSKSRAIRDLQDLVEMGAPGRTGKRRHTRYWLRRCEKIPARAQGESNFPMISAGVLSHRRFNRRGGRCPT